MQVMTIRSTWCFKPVLSFLEVRAFKKSKGCFFALLFLLAGVEAHAQADLVTVKSLSVGSSNVTAVGDPVFFEITVTNTGPDDATNVVLTDQVPAGLALVQGTGNVAGALANNFLPSATIGTYDTATGVWTIGSLASGASATLFLTVYAQPSAMGSTVVNAATAAATPDQVDPTAAGDDL